MKQLTQNFVKDFELALRIALFIAFVCVGSIVLVAGAKQALAATLKSEAAITDDYIRLGDIFSGVKNADYILGPAPQPGNDMILNARTLYKIASALDVKWTPATSAEQIVLRREASIVPVTAITDALNDHISQNAVKDKFTINYTTAPSDMVLPFGTSQTLDITAFSFDPANDSFNAVLVSPSKENPLRRTSVSGRIERLIAVPVLMNALRPGDIIGAMDIDYIDMPQNRIPSGTVLNEKDLVNMAPRRAVASGKPLNVNELEHPKMVDRGDLVTLIFANGPMMLTVKGKSLQAGAIGDTVRVSNSESNRSLQGIVTAHREITIR